RGYPGIAPIVGIPLALPPKLPVHDTTARESRCGSTLCSFFSIRLVLMTVKESRLSASENSSSSPPQMTRPSVVARRYRYGFEASQISAFCGQIAVDCGRVAIAHVDKILLPVGGTILTSS